MCGRRTHRGTDAGDTGARGRGGCPHPGPDEIVVEEVRASADPDALLLEWGEAPKGSIGWRKALSYEDALDLLRVALSD